MTTKICTNTECSEKGKPQLLDNFYTSKDKIQSYCKECRKRNRREHYLNNKERAIKDAIRWQKLNRKKAIESVKKVNKKRQIEIADSYVRLLLRVRGFSKETIDSDPYYIRKARRDLINKRIKWGRPLKINQ
jgi:hypothetical protein